MKAADRLLTELAGLRAAKAPDHLAERVRETLGLQDRYFEIDTLIGPFFVAFRGDRLSALVRADSPRSFERWFESRFRRPVSKAAEIPTELHRAITGILRGKEGGRIKYDLSSLSDFERAVLTKTSEIPRGEVRSYAWVAREIGKPKAVRAVGSALGRNPIPLLIPCHRVVRSDGTTGHYGLGAENKKLLLEAEADHRSIA